MDLWTIIPVKPFGLGKSRLAPVLSAPERAALNRAMFEHVLRTAIAAFGAARIVVVTADAEAASLAGQHAAQVLPEHTADDLNGALASGMTYVRAHGAEAALVLPSDLPHLGRDDLMAISAALRQAPCCVVAPDLSRTGTNALAMAPPDATFLRFGPESFARHAESRARPQARVADRHPPRPRLRSRHAGRLSRLYQRRRTCLALRGFFGAACCAGELSSVSCRRTSVAAARIVLTNQACAGSTSLNSGYTRSIV